VKKLKLTCKYKCLAGLEEVRKHDKMEGLLLGVRRRVAALLEVNTLAFVSIFIMGQREKQSSRNKAD
jgi:hypothetical protein